MADQELVKKTQKSIRNNSIAAVVNVILFTVLCVMQGVQLNGKTYSFQQQQCTNTTIIKEKLWPVEDELRTCVARTIVFTQLEAFCRETNGSKDIEVHALTDHEQKYITLTIQARRQSRGLPLPSVP